MMRFAPIALFVLLCALFAGMLLTKPSTPRPLPSALIGKPLPEITLPALANAAQTQLHPDNLKNQITIINVFASWCVPCLAEHGLWKNITNEHEVQLIGIGWKDTPENLKQWLEKHGNPYSQTLVDAKGSTTTALGITGVPETYILDKNGIIRYKLAMPLTESIIRDEILPLIKTLEQP
jgi:cytochrome c biogenesis protein CcmG/thiol:disulfide interchange protein DsbE